MQRFELSLLDIALAAKVRLMAVWKIEQGLPIRDADAQAVRSGLYRLTGAPYTALIPIIPAYILLIAQASQAGKKP